MCGIIGYAGSRPAATVLIDSLRRLEYRGYDSAGVAILDENGTGRHSVVKSDRKVDDLAKRFEAEGMPKGHLGIGHTRWATHGRPTVVNAHPHQDCEGRIQLIHNGIIENYRELAAELAAKGHEFLSETDTEVAVHLIEEYYDGDLAAATRKALARITGAYAFVIISADEPDLVVGARLNAPLVVGLGEGEVFVSSDITALIPYTKEILLVGDGEVVTATPRKSVVTKIDGSEVTPRIITVDWEAEQAQKSGYPHFMLKEIHEQPEALGNAMRGRISDDGIVTLPELEIDAESLKKLRSISIVACGSAELAGGVTKYAIERLARIPCALEIASEFRYEDPIVGPENLIVAFSQSGETADTLAAVREAKQRGAKVVAITNVVGSALSLEADSVIYMQSGPEIGVCATKTFMSQMVCGYLVALRLAAVRGTLTETRHREITAELMRMPAMVTEALALEPQLAETAQRYSHSHNAVFIARGINVPVALEGALKLKEVSYIHAEGFAAGELKHGPIALLDRNVPVVALATRSETLTKVVSNVQEVRSREAPVLAIVSRGENPFEEGLARDVVEVPACSELLSPLVNVVPLQLFAYYVAVERGCNVDQPRNLAKSVTVE